MGVFLINKTLAYCLFILLVISNYSIMGEISEISNFEKNKNFNNSWIEEKNGIQIVHLNGSFYQMGFQQGFFLKEKIIENLRGFKHYILEQGIPFSEFIEVWNIQKNYITQETINYIQGISDGASVSFEDIAFMWVWEGVLYFQCTSFACWGNATNNSELIHVRSLDWPDDIIDPISGKYAEENSVIIIGKPDHGYSFMYPTFAGYGVEDGINENGISVCDLWSSNNDQTVYGSPMNIRLFEALFNSYSIEDAINIINSNKTFGYNFIVTDAKNPIGYLIETTANHTYIGTWNSNSESTPPFWQIKEVIRRGNMFIDPLLASTQRGIYNPRDIRYILGLENGFSFYANWLRYKAMSNGIESNLGNINLNNSIEIMRNLYSGEYDFIWKIFCNIYPDLPSRWQFSTNPKTGDMLLSFADKNNKAHQNPIFHYNFYELLNSEPP